MSSTPDDSGLRRVAPHTYAYLQLPGTWGWSNAGLVVGADGDALLVDTAYTLDLTRRLLDAITADRPDAVIRTVVATHGNGDHINGVQLVVGAELVTSAATAHELPTEITPATMTALGAMSPDSPIGAYQRHWFGSFDWAGIEQVPPACTFSGRLTLDVGGRAVELIEAGPAHSCGDVLVHVPDAGVVYAGDLLFIGDHPVMWAGPWRNWVVACDTILATGATTIVPGHGPITNPDGVRRFRSYLEYVGMWAETQYAAGVPYEVAATTIPLAEYADFGLPERLIITIGVIYGALGQPVPGGREALISRLAAHWHSAQKIYGK